MSDIIEALVIFIIFGAFGYTTVMSHINQRRNSDRITKAILDGLREPIWKMGNDKPRKEPNVKDNA